MTADETIREVIAHIAACEASARPIGEIRVTRSHGATEGRIRVAVLDSRTDVREAIMHPDDWGRVVDLAADLAAREDLDEWAVPEAARTLCGIPIIVEDDAV